jgi:hypothetical protein
MGRALRFFLALWPKERSMESADRVPLPLVRTEFGFQRTACACESCSFYCKVMPGYLVPSDLVRLCPPGADLMTWAKEHLRASRGFLGPHPITGELTQIPTLVPAKQANGHCHWLQPDGRCVVHANSPFGCAFLDQHMSDYEAGKRNLAGRLARLRGFDDSGPYSQVWNMLMEAGLVGGGEYGRAMLELEKLQAKRARRAAQKARKARRKERKRRRKKGRG